MLLRRTVLDAIAAGTVSLVFRRWVRPTVKSGGRLHTAIGVLAIEDLTEIDETAIDLTSARKAGYDTVEALKADLAATDRGRLYRIAVRLAGEDPRVALRADDRLDTALAAQLGTELRKLDDARPWTRSVLELIAARPGQRAAHLAQQLGQPVPALKVDVRKLKALGLTESLDIGYRLSPRGKALLELMRGGQPQ